MRRGIMILALAAVLLAVAGCTGGGTPSGSENNSGGVGGVGGGEKSVVNEDYIIPDYVPDSRNWKGLAKQITGEFGQETEAKIPSLFLTAEEPDNILRNVYSPCTIQIDAGMAEGYESTEVLTAEIRGRGHSTWDWPKKPYKIKLEEGASLLGLDPAREWVLIANYADESLIRNTVAFEMARSLGSFRFTPHAIPVNVYMNGVYQGVYTLGEQLEVNSSRLNIDADLEDPDTGYLLEIGGADPLEDEKGVNYFDLPSGCGKDVLIKSPNSGKWSEEHFGFIYDYMCKADAAITSLDGYEEYINVDSFIDWFLIHELTYNLDSCFHRSCYITKPAGGKLEMGPVWDFDLAFGNMYMDNPDYNDWATVGSYNSDAYITETWFNHLMEDESFRSKARARWAAVRDDLMACAEQAIDDTRALIGSSADDNFTVWDTLSIANGYQPEKMATYSTYMEQVHCLRRFLTSRSKWIDEHL